VSQTGSPRVGVHVFYGIVKGEAGDHWRDLLWHRRLMIDRVPTNILPIAEDEGGNQICLSLRPESCGWIYYWDHELEAEEGEPATFDNMSKINSSFRGFVQSLKPDPIILKPGQKPDERLPTPSESQGGHREQRGPRKGDGKRVSKDESGTRSRGGGEGEEDPKK